MEAAVSFLTSLCAASLLFSLLLLLVPPDTAGKGVRLAASAFLLLILLRGLADLPLSFSRGDTPELSFSAADKTTEEAAKEALTRETEKKLTENGCRFTRAEASLSYGDGGFTDIALTVKTNDPSEEEKIRAALLEWEIPVTVLVEGGENDG